jgi:alkaline phosphatase D
MMLGIPAAGAMVACRRDDETPARTGDTGSAETPRAAEPAALWPGVGAPDPVAFPLGMQTGEPHDDGLVVWVYAPGAATATLHGAAWDGAAWVPLDPITVSPSAEGYAHAEVTGLGADVSVAWQTEAGGAYSPIAHGRTAIARDAAAEVRLGACSCLDQAHGEFPCLDAVQELGPIDAFVWLGDTIYADSRVDEPGYRALWQEQLSKPSFQRLLSKVPGVFTWDDHEVDNNWSPQSVSPARFAAAVKTFHETLPFPASVRDGGPLWRSLRFGRTVELFMLDCRGERDVDAGEYVSAQQLQWLIDGLRDSEAVWKVVATSVPITDWPGPWDLAQAQLDRWDGFPGTQRATLIEAAKSVRGVMFLSGDLHQTTLSRVDPPGGPGEGLTEFLAGPGGSFLNAAARLLEGEQFPYADADWSAARMVFWPDGTAQLQTAYEGGLLMMDARIDVDGAVDVIVAAHPWELD